LNTDRAVEKTGAGLTVVLVVGSLLVASVLVIVILLVVSGFLSVPLFVMAAVAFAALVLFGFSIAAAVLSRRRG
jgi:hypothetical protein